MWASRLYAWDWLWMNRARHQDRADWTSSPLSKAAGSPSSTRNHRHLASFRGRGRQCHAGRPNAAAQGAQAGARRPAQGAGQIAPQRRPWRPAVGRGVLGRALADAELRDERRSNIVLRACCTDYLLTRGNAR